MTWYWRLPIPSRCVAALVALAILPSGCSDDRQSRPSAKRRTVVEDMTGITTGGIDELAKDKVVKDAPPVPVPTEPKPKPEPKYNVAEVGADDAQAGSTIGGGILTEPLHQRFHIAHRIVFIQIESVMKLFRGSNGHFPKSHEEFMEKIIRANGINLPELRDGWDYFYDAKDHELKKRKET